MRRHSLAAFAILVLAAAAFAHAAIAKGGDTTTVLKATLTRQVPPHNVHRRRHCDDHDHAVPGLLEVQLPRHHEAGRVRHPYRAAGPAWSAHTIRPPLHCHDERDAPVRTADEVGRRERPEVDRENPCQPGALLRHRRRRQGIPRRRDRRRSQSRLTCTPHNTDIPGAALGRSPGNRYGRRRSPSAQASYMLHLHLG